MKNVTRGIQILVGLLFILSGLVKANDPLGLAYKMQEFFEVWTNEQGATHFLSRILHFFNGQALTLSAVMIALEVVAGVALLTGWRPRRTLNLLALLILFFTFLTAYAWGSGKFKNCGCFGDCLPLTPLTSLLKDILLCIAIGFLIWRRREMFALANLRKASVVVTLSLLAVMGLQAYVLRYLPLADCLPFAVGKSIPEGMQIPKNAITDSFAIRFVYEKEGKKFEFSPAELPNDLGSYKYIDRIQTQVRKGNAEPAIKGFALLSQSGEDSSAALLSAPQALLVFCLRKDDEVQWASVVNRVASEARSSGKPAALMTSKPVEMRRWMEGQTQRLPVFACDDVPVRMAARAEGVVIWLEHGVVKRKESIHSLSRAVP